MTVKELIEELQKMPQEARVFHLWDGEPRTAINVVYLSRTGNVITAGRGEVCYSTDHMPPDVELSELGSWYTPDDGKYHPEDDLDY